jgi:DNA polymerase I-like protein with 3'-5' exonuclease and polymerase domains
MLVTDADQLYDAVGYLQNEAEFFCFDVETIGFRGDPWRNDVVWIGIGDDKHQWSVPLNFPNGDLIEEGFPLKDTEDLRERLARGLKPRKSDYSVDRKKITRTFSDPTPHLDRTTAFGILKPLMFDDNVLKVGHNLSFDVGSVAKYLGDIPSGPYACTMVASFLVDSSRAFGYGLKDVAKIYCDIDVEKGVGAEVESHAFEVVSKYVLLDVKASASVWVALRDRIQTDRLSQVFSLEMDVLPVITKMRLAGTPIDTDQLDRLKDQLDADAEVVRTKIEKTAGRKFNLNANSDKQALLYGPKDQGGRGLRPTTLTPKGKEKKRAGIPLTISDYSVSAEALEVFRGKDHLVDLLLEHAGLSKLLSTYVLPYRGDEAKKGLVDNGLIHTDFNPIGAQTGRFSSRNPNLQNVPSSGTHYGRLIRDLFVAPPGHSLVVADYSQIEPRLIAGFSQDAVMLETYRDGGDIYTAIGDRMGVDRKAGKVLVLSIAYGVGPDKISRQLGIAADEAKSLLDDFGDKFKSINKLKALTIKQARMQNPPFVSTITGRRRYLPDLDSDTGWIRAKAQRQAFNTLIQGSAADVMKIALVRADQMLPEGAYLVLTVHDEMVVVTPDALVEESIHAVTEAMEGVYIPRLGVPLKAEVTSAQRWGEAK